MMLIGVAVILIMVRDQGCLLYGSCRVNISLHSIVFDHITNKRPVRKKCVCVHTRMGACVRARYLTNGAVVISISKLVIKIR